jgi:hypothetical protein
MSHLSERNEAVLEQLAAGRRVVNVCMFGWLAAAAFHITAGPLALLFFLGSTVAAVFGTRRLAEGLALQGWRVPLAVFGSVIPVFGLLIMGWLSTRAAQALRSAGYRVGMFVSSKAGAA